MSEFIAVFFKLLLTLAAVYGLVAIGAHFLSLRMIFPRPPVSYVLSADYVQLATSDGERLIARHWPSPNAKYTMLYLHGNYEDLGTVGEYIPQFIAAGYAVFALDYRHYGYSGGTPTETNTNQDVLLAYEYMRNTLHIPAERIIIFGYSLGSGPGVELALHQPAAGLVLQGAYVSTYRVLTRYALIPGDKFVNIGKVPQLKLPIFVIHGTADSTVPFWHSEALFDVVTSRKMKLFVEGGPHSRLGEYTGPRYWEELKKFTDSLR